MHSILPTIFSLQLVLAVTTLSYQPSIPCAERTGIIRFTALGEDGTFDLIGSLSMQLLPRYKPSLAREKNAKHQLPLYFISEGRFNCAYECRSCRFLASAEQAKGICLGDFK